LEQLCAEYDSIDEFLTNLEDRVLENSALLGSPLKDLPELSTIAPLRRGLSQSGSRDSAK
jgi:hypothetical protein